MLYFKKKTKLIYISILICLALNVSGASNREKAKSLYHSLAGVSPTTAELNYLEAQSYTKSWKALGKEIIDEQSAGDILKNSGSFYNITVKDFATPWSNESGSTMSELNDMTSTVVGFVRDERPFDKILWQDVVYKATGVVFAGEIYYFRKNSIPSRAALSGVPVGAPNPSAICVESDAGKEYFMYHKNPSNPNDQNDWQCRLTKYTKSQLDAYKLNDALYIPHIDTILDTNRIKENNAHYVSLDELGIDLSDDKILVPTTQETKLHRYTDAISGLFTTRGFGAAFYSAGTNRAAFAFAVENFLCKTLEELNDTTIPDYRVRRDIDRSPGGESSTYKNRCVGCHAGMDAMSGAFAYYDFNGAITYEFNEVVPKMNHNIVFSDGFVTSTSSWINTWNQGKNKSMGWGKVAPSPGGAVASQSGYGVKSLALMFSQTESFYSCMATQVFEKVCFKPKSKMSKNSKDRIITKNTNTFKVNKNMKDLFLNTAADCVEY